MNRKDFAVVVLRLMAVYLALNGLSALLPTLGSAISSFTQEFNADSNFMIATGALYGLSYMIGCGILWPLAPKIASYIERDLPPAEPKENEFNTFNVQVIGLSILGFFILSSAIPTFAKIITAVWLPSLDTSFPKMLSSLSGEKVAIIPWSDLIYLFVQLTLGFWFILGASGIITLLKKVRYAGRKTI